MTSPMTISFGSRISCGTQHPFRDSQLSCVNFGVLLHELGHDFVLALHLGFNLLDLLVLAVLGTCGRSRKLSAHSRTATSDTSKRPQTYPNRRRNRMRRFPGRH